MACDLAVYGRFSVSDRDLPLFTVVCGTYVARRTGRSDCSNAGGPGLPHVCMPLLGYEPDDGLDSCDQGGEHARPLGAEPGHLDREQLRQEWLSPGYSDDRDGDAHSEEDP
jgi:hypothetical protein